MANKKQMLEGLKEMKKILLDAQRGKSKTRPPIDIKDKKGMEKVIKEIGKKNGGGFDEEFKELRERMKAEARAKAKPTAQSRKEKLPQDRKKTAGKFNLDLMQGTGALKKEDFPPKKEKKEKKIVKSKKRTSPKVVSPGKQKPTMTDEQVRAELEAKNKPRMGILTGRRAPPIFSRMKKMNMGGVMKNRGGTFKGTY